MSGSFEAALNLLREQRRAVKDVRWDLMRDEDLKRSDPEHRNQLLAQTQDEQTQLTAAIDLLELVESGRMVTVAVDAATAAPALLDEVAERLTTRRYRQHGLVKRTVEVRP